MSRLAESFERVVRAIMRDVRYHKLYPCTVQGQADDGHLDLLPDDDEIQAFGLSVVPIRHGLPGMTVRVLVGSRVMLGFENGDPQRPYAALWEPGQIESISFDGGDKPIARVGDAVTVFWPPAVAVTGTLAGSPFAGTMTITSPGTGIIRDGNNKVQA